MSFKIEDQLEETRMAIEGVLDNPPLQARLKSVGFGLDKVRKGKAIYEKVKMMWEAMRQGYGNQYEATDLLAAARKEANRYYNKHIKIARIAIPKENRNLWSRLELAEPRKRTLTPWIRQAESFYINIEDALDMMAVYGIKQEELAQAKAMVEAVAAARVKRNSSKSIAQQATKNRNDALKELNQWKRDYKYAIRYAFLEDKQQMEALGVVIPS